MTEEDVELCREAGLKLIGVNNTWPFDLDVHVTVNPEWWDLYMDEDADLWTMMESTDCWCSDAGACERWGLKHFKWTDDAEMRGLSINPHDVALGHSSGFAALNIAVLMGCDPVLLLGHDMRFPKGYDGRKQIAGGKRHFFGEYPKKLARWPSVKVRHSGELDGLINCYTAVAARPARARIVNVTPNSALECFQQRTLREALDEIPQ